MKSWAVPASIVVAGGLVGAGLYFGLRAQGGNDWPHDPRIDLPAPPPVEPLPVPIADTEMERARNQMESAVRHAVDQQKPRWVSQCVTPIAASPAGPPPPWKLRVRVATNHTGQVIAAGIHVDVGSPDLRACLGELDFLNNLSLPHAAVGVELVVELP